MQLHDSYFLSRICLLFLLVSSCEAGLRVRRRRRAPPPPPPPPKATPTTFPNKAPEGSSVAEAAADIQNTPDADQRDVPVTEQRGSPDAEQQNTPDAEQQNTPDVEQQNTPDAEQQNTPDVEQQNTPDAEQQNTPDAEQQNTPDAEQQNTPDVEQQNTPNDEQQESVLTLTSVMRYILVPLAIVCVSLIMGTYVTMFDGNHTVNLLQAHIRDTIPKRKNNVKKPDEIGDAIFYVKNSLTQEWQDVGRYLGLSHADIEHIKEEYDTNSKERNYQMLQKWREQYGRQATLEALEDALRKAGRRDLAENLTKGMEEKKR